MMARLGQNLGLKLLSLACSFALFLYVHKQQTSEVQFLVPLVILLDPNTRVTDPALLHRTVSVTLWGPAQRLKDLERQTRAVADLRGHGSGAHLQPVEVHAGSENSSEAHDPVDVNWTPRVISIELEQRSARHLLVQPIFNVQPPPGFSLNRARAVPNAAVVSGWESDLRPVKRLQAVINSFGSPSLPEVALV